MKNHFSRNIGILTEAHQQKLEESNVIICGVGGMGGVTAEALVRMGVRRMTIVDHDVYELSNINRQIHCTEETIGRRKVDVVAEKLRAINSELQLVCYHGLTEENVQLIVKRGDILVNGMDDVRASILLERTARAQKKTIVNAWITPYASVFVTTPASPHWEEFLKFPTLGKKISDITDQDVAECLKCEIMFTLKQFQPLTIVTEELIQDVLSNARPRPSLVPVVWLSGTLMANEVMKIITHQGKIASHWGVFYNQYDHEIRNYKEQEHENGVYLPAAS